MEPGFVSTRIFLGKTLVSLGRFEDAVEHLKAAEGTDSVASFSLGSLGHAYGMAGRRDEAIAELQRLRDLSTRRYVPHVAFAMIYLGLGDVDQAFSRFNQAVDEREFAMTFIKFTSDVDPLRDDPRFGALLDRIGFPADPPAPRVEPVDIPIPVIGVLPFEMMRENEDAAFLADEIPASVIDSLSGLGGVRIVPRSSSFRHRDSSETIQQIGRALGADYILTGQILPRADDLRIRAELVAVRSDRQVWSDRIDRSLSDTLAAETEMTGKIVEALMLPMTTEESRRLAARRPVNHDAHAAYLKGVFWWHRTTADSIPKALEQFNRAIELDPNYALAYLGLADTYNALAVYMHPAAEVVPKSIAAVERALELDPGLADAYHARAWHQFTWYGDWDAAERDLGECIRLNPRNNIARLVYGWWHFGRGNLEQALSEFEEARRLDPGSAGHVADVGVLQIYAGRYEEARIALRDALEVDPTSGNTNAYLVLLDTLEGRNDAAIARARSMEREGMMLAIYYGSLGKALASAGRTDEARQELARLQRLHEQTYVPAPVFAEFHDALGDPEAAMDWLETAYEDRAPTLFIALHARKWSDLRESPRFRDLCRNVGVDPDWVAPGVIRSNPIGN